MADLLAQAVDALDRGELVVYPTDTLIGLGARADRPEAVARLFEAKARPRDQAIAFAVSSHQEIEPVGALTPERRAQARRLLPGPFTLLLPAVPATRRRLAPGLVSSSGTIGVRIPDHPVARELARRAGPITCTSANRHGRPTARTVRDARREFGRAVRVYLPSRPEPGGSASTLIDLTGNSPRRLGRR